jgi:hypothetical protein
VITTSNVTAHLAGALGKRTWLLFPADNPPFHYWAPGDDRRSLWYPSVEIVSSVRLTDWRSLAGEAAARLQRETQAFRAPGVSVAESVGARTAGDPAAGVRAQRVEGRIDDANALAGHQLERTPDDAPLERIPGALRWQDKSAGARRRSCHRDRARTGVVVNLVPLGSRARRRIEAYRKALADPSTLKPEQTRAFGRLHAREDDAYFRAVVSIRDLLFDNLKCVARGRRHRGGTGCMQARGGIGP